MPLGPRLHAVNLLAMAGAAAVACLGVLALSRVPLPWAALGGLPSPWLAAGLVAVGGLSCLAASSLFLRRCVTAPLDRLGETAKAVALGDQARLCPWPAGQDDEIGRLALVLEGILGEQRAARTRLEHRLEERTREIVEVRQRLWAESELLALAEREASLARLRSKAAEAVKDRFLSNMSHELRTPLHAITGFARLLLEGRSQARQRLYLERLLQGALELGRQLTDILELASLETEARPGRSQCVREIDPAGHALEAIQGLSGLNGLGGLGELARIKGVALSVRPIPGLPAFVAGDAGVMGRLLSSMAGASLTCLEQGEVRVEVGLEDDPEQGSLLVYRVLDTGRAMSPEEFQAALVAGSTAPAFEAGCTALGLAVANRLAAMLGGAMALERAPGWGNAILARFPVRVTREAAASALEDQPDLAQPHPTGTDG